MRKITTAIVTCVVALIVSFWLFPTSTTRIVKTADDVQESFVTDTQEKSYLELGVESLDAGQQDAAWKYLTAAIDEEPDNPDAYFYRSLVALNLHDRAQRDADLAQALRLNPDHLKALLWQTSSFCLSSRAEDEKCFTGVKHILEVDPGNFEAFLMRAERHSDMEEFDKAIADYTSAIENIPDDIDPSVAYNAYVGRAGIYFERNALQKAIADFNAALDADPKMGPYVLYGAYGAFNRRLSIIDPESENYAEMEKLIGRLKN